jgi:predicted nucleotidyltransferase
MVKLGSPIREKVLVYFFTNPHQELHLRQIARILNIDAGNLSKEMEKAEKENIFKIEKKGNLKLYSLNKKHPLYNELKKIIDKTIGIEARFKKAFEKVAGIETAFIFGSFASQKQDQFSDIDLMIIGKPDEDILISEISLIEESLQREINYSIFSAADFKKGLKNREVFLEQIISEPKIFIIGNENDLAKIIGRRKSSKKEN